MGSQVRHDRPRSFEWSCITARCPSHTCNISALALERGCFTDGDNSHNFLHRRCTMHSEKIAKRLQLYQRRLATTIFQTLKQSVQHHRSILDSLVSPSMSDIAAEALSIAPFWHVGRLLKYWLILHKQPPLSVTTQLIHSAVKSHISSTHHGRLLRNYSTVTLPMDPGAEDVLGGLRALSRIRPCQYQPQRRRILRRAG